MNQKSNLPEAKDKTLFTPGPLTTSLSVKQAMLHDAGSWHWEFNDLVRRIREQLLALAGVSRANGFEAILMQGSGTFGVESALGSVVPPAGKLVVLANGATASASRRWRPISRSPRPCCGRRRTKRRTSTNCAAPWRAIRPART